MTIKAVFFDIDGTLIDSNDAHVEVWSEVLASAGHPFDRAAIHAQIGKGSDMFVPALLPNADPETVERLGKAHGDRFKRYHLRSVTPFPGARDLLRRVHAAGQRVILASSASAAELDYYIDLLGARDLVEATTTADDVERTKPAPDIIRAALDKVAPLGPDECTMIGDSPFDVEAAARCGVATIALRSGGFPDTVLREAGARVIYPDVAALLADYGASPLARTFEP